MNNQGPTKPPHVGQSELTGALGYKVWRIDMACFKFNEIPENANFIAQQPDGEWWWYEKEPMTVTDGNTGTGWRPTGGFCGRLYQQVDEWQQTLSAL